MVLDVVQVVARQRVEGEDRPVAAAGRPCPQCLVGRVEDVVRRGDPLGLLGELAGDQWNEGDVSCSVVRRVALPDAFFAVDGLFQTFLTVLDEFGAFPAVIQRELDRYLPFLATTKVLMSAVRNGVGRETAHEAIKEAAVGTALSMRQGQAENDVFAKLAADERLGLTQGQLEALVAAHADIFESVRGQGLMLGLKCRIAPTDLVKAGYARRILTVPAADNTLRLLPPLNITDDEIAEAVTRLDHAADSLHA